MIYFRLFMFQMYSISLTFQQKEPKNHSNDMNDHKNLEVVSLTFQQKEPKNHSNDMNDHKNLEGDKT